MTSSNQLQRQAESHRQELSDSLDGLRSAVTPSHVTSEVLNLARDSSMSIAKALAEQARANPIPALLIGAGLVMLLARTANGAAGGGSRGPDLVDKAGATLKSAASAGIDAVRGTADAVRGVQRTAADTASYAGDLASDATHRAGDLAFDTARRAAYAASGLSEAAASVAQNARATARDTLDKAGELGSAALETARATASEVRDGVAGTASALMQQGQQSARELADRAQHLTGNARSYASTMAEEQPIMVAALGAAIGAALGAALPMTDAERRYLGSTSARAKQAGSDAVAKVAEVAKSETAGGDIGAKVDGATGKP